MDYEAQLRILEAARGDPAKFALATVDLAFSDLAVDDLAMTRQALEIAAIPHWCDDANFPVLLDIPAGSGALLLERLRKLAIVERFPARGEAAINVHEGTRLVLRRSLASEQSERFRSLSARAADHFASDLTPAGRIEWIYHRLCSVPEEAAGELEQMNRNWSGYARPDDRQALAAAMWELDRTSLVHDRARVWVRLTIAWARVSRGETAQLGDEAAEILGLAREAGDQRGEADAHALLGDVQKNRGNLTKASAAYEESLAINRRLAESNPSNAGWQRDLAVAQSRLGNVLPALTQTVHVVDDDEAMRTSLTRLLSASGIPCKAYRSAEEFISACPAIAAGCVLLDLSMPGCTGLELQEKLSQAGRVLQIIFLSSNGDVPTSVRAMKLGAVDFLTKPVAKNQLLAAIQTAFARDEASRQHQAVQIDLGSRLSRLTPREDQVIRLVARGLLNKQIAAELGTVEKTVKVHRARALAKLEINSVAEIAMLLEHLDPVLA